MAGKRMCRDCVFHGRWGGAGEVTEGRYVHRNENRRPGHSHVNAIRRMKNQKRDPDNKAKRGESGVQSSRSQGRECFKGLFTSVSKSYVLRGNT